MKERIPNILRAGVILMVLTVWLPTAAVLVAPHSNEWVERSLETADIYVYCGKRFHTPYSYSGRECRQTMSYKAQPEWDGWMIYGPITLALFAGLYFVSGSLSLRPIRVREG